MHPKSITRLLLFILLPLWSQAQPQTLTLKECIDYGLKNFGTIRIAQYNQETARQQGREALSAYLPQASASATLTNNLKLTPTLLPAGFNGSTEPTILTFGQPYQTNAVAQASQKIFDQSLLLGIKADKPNRHLADLNTRQTREDVVYNIATNYYRVMVARQQIGLLEDNLKRTQQVLDVLKLQRDQGVIVPVDYTNTEVNYNNTRSQLSLAENDVTLALNRLRYQMGLSQDANLALADSVSRDLPVIDDMPFEATRLVSFQQAATGIELQQLQLRRIRAGYLPTVSLNFAYGTLNFAKSFGEVFNSKLRGFGTLALQVNLPIFDGFRRDAQVQQQKLTLLTQDEQQRLNTSAYRLQFSNALSQLQRARVLVDNDSRNVKLAQNVYDITALQYKQGVKTLTDLLNADNSYRQSQFNYINSLISFYTARLDREQAQGTLLDFYNEL